MSSSGTSSSHVTRSHQINSNNPNKHQITKLIGIVMVRHHLNIEWIIFTLMNHYHYYCLNHYPNQNQNQTQTQTNLLISFVDGFAALLVVGETKFGSDDKKSVFKFVFNKFSLLIQLFMDDICVIFIGFIETIS
eukprot:447754_1